MYRRGWNKLLSFSHRRRSANVPAVVLAYHSIGERLLDPYGQAVRPATFAEQLRVLQDRADVVPVNELVQRLIDGRSTERTAVVTFDDGYVDTLTTALPIAERIGVPITVFITTSPLLDTTDFWWDTLAQLVLARRDGEGIGPVDMGDLRIELRDASTRLDAYRRIHERLRRMEHRERNGQLRALRLSLPMPADAFDVGRPMTGDELATLASHPLVTIGAHTVSHPSLADLRSDSQRRELVESRALLESRLGCAVDLLAYPFGKRDNVSATTREIARQTGYRAAFETIPAAVRSPVDHWAVPRLSMHDWQAAEFEVRLDRVLYG